MSPMRQRAGWLESFRCLFRLYRGGAGQTSPGPSAEGERRTMHARLSDRARAVAPDSLRASIDSVLRELREAFHRRARLSSRNEALDEISKLIFAQVVLGSHGRKGITELESSPNPARKLRDLVGVAIRKHLPA